MGTKAHLQPAKYRVVLAAGELINSNMFIMVFLLNNKPALVSESLSLSVLWSLKIDAAVDTFLSFSLNSCSLEKEDKAVHLLKH